MSYTSSCCDSSTYCDSSDDSGAIRLATHHQHAPVIAAEPVIRRLPPTEDMLEAAAALKLGEPLLIAPDSVTESLESLPKTPSTHVFPLPARMAESSAASMRYREATGPPPVASAPSVSQRIVSQRDRAHDQRRVVEQQQMAATIHRAHGHIQKGVGLAARGAMFSARNQFVRALREVSDSMDAQFATDRHSAALRRGLRALDEAKDFMTGEAEDQLDIDVATVVAGHRTAVCKPSANGQPAGRITVRDALDAYYREANEGMIEAAAELPVTAAALFGLGKVHASLAELRTEDRAIHEYRAMALYHASLSVDGRNPYAANELGVLMARYGRNDAAVQLFQHSLAYQNNANVWRNLSVAMNNLGQRDLARQALERAKSKQTTAGRPFQPVQWLDNGTFAGTTQSADVAGHPAAHVRKSSWSPPASPNLGRSSPKR